MLSTKRKKKHSYLLLELLIGLTLVTLCLAPMLGSPQLANKKQKKELSRIYMQWEGEKILCSLEQKLRTGDIPWDTLLKSQDKKNLLYEEKSPTLRSRVYLSKGKQGDFFQDKEGNWIGKVSFSICLYLPNESTALYQLTAVFFISKKRILAPHYTGGIPHAT